MKVKIESVDLKEMLKVPCATVEVRPAKVALGCVELTAKNGALMASSCSRTVASRSGKHCEVIEEGSVLVDGKMLSMMVNKLPGFEVTISDGKNGKVRFECAGNKTDMMSVSDEMLKAEREDDPLVFEVNAKNFAKAANAVMYAAAREEGARPVLTGVLMEIGPEGINMAACDGGRMAVATMTDERVDDKRNVVIPRAALQAVVQNAVASAMARKKGEEDEVNVKLMVGRKRLIYRDDLNELNIGLLSGNYIEYRRVLPETFNVQVRVRVDYLREAVDRAMLAVNSGSGIVQLGVHGDDITVIGNGLISNVEEKVQCYGNGDVEIAFNVRFLSELLGTVKDEEVDMNLVGTLKPMVVDSVDGGVRVKHMLMPTRLLGGTT